MTAIVKKLIIDCHTDNCQLVKYLTRTDTFDIKEIDWNGDNLLIHAVKANKPLSLRVLLEYGADVKHINSTTYEDSALSWAVFKGYTPCTRLLIQYGSDLDHQTKVDGNSLLMWSYKQDSQMDFMIVLYSGGNYRLKNRHDQDIYDQCYGSRTYFRILTEYMRLIESTVKIFFYRYNRNFEHSLIKYVLEFI